ncbi:NADH-quinone oxidoreductase subunit NuoE [Streptomyces sclerotialus]|uniref:NADH-quinone oxidoreductase subunit NuoE n=1 Tax=Streptomyces sclerotialus TaxID=1957 RepID=UPI00068FE99A
MPQLPAPDYPADVRARLEADAKEVIARYPGSRSALLPLLHLVQSEEGHVTRTGIRFCAEMLDLTTAEVTAVSTFYTMYRRKPSGDYQVGVCTNTLCAVMGGDAIFDELKEHLGVGNNETTADGKVTLEHIECNAACDFAPVVMVNWEFFDNQTPESAKRLVDDLRAGRPVTPTRGAPLCTFKETARILAGFPDGREGAVEASGGAGPASLAGLRLARGEALPGGTDHVVAPRDGAHPTEEAPAAGAAGEAPATHPSSHDAPRDTSASDPANPSPPTAPGGGAPPRGDIASGPVAEEGE